MLGLQKIVKNIMALSLDQKTYLADILLKDIEARKVEHSGMERQRTVGEYIGKIEMSDDFDAPLPDEFWFGSSDETAA